MITLSRSTESLELQLERERVAARKILNDRMIELRQIFITDLPGQDMIYKAKEIEAIAYLEMDPAPVDLTDFPFLSDEIGLTAPTAYELAQVWLNMSVMWRSVASQLESIRLTVGASIDGATSGAEVDLALNTLNAAVSSL